MMSRHKDLAKNTLIIAFGKLSTQFLTFLLLPLYTTYLVTSEFGMFDLIMTYIMLLAPIITLQLEMSSFRFLIDARDDKRQQKAIISSVLRNVAKFVGLFTLLCGALNLVIAIPHSMLIYGAVVAVVVSNIFLQFARGFGDNRKFAFGGVVAGISAIVTNIVFIVGLGMGAGGMLAAIMLSNIACALYLFYALKLHRYIELSLGDASLDRKLLGYSIPLVPNGVSWWLINAADRTIITIFLGVASNGIYAVAYRFPLIFNGLFSFFGMSWTESASVHINSPDRDKFFSQTMNASIRFFGSLAVGMVAFIPLVFGLFVHQNYSEAYVYIPILMAGAFLNSIVGLYGAIYIAKKMTRQVMNTSLISAAISIGFTMVFVHSLGIYAAAFAMVIAYLSMAIYRHYDVKKHVTITYDGRVFILLGLLFAFTTSFYYLNNPLGNIVNAVVTTGLIVLFNKSIISILKSKFIQRRALTPEQATAEVIESHISERS